MERSTTKYMLVLALLFATFVVRLEARNIPTEPKTYQPQNIPGIGGGFGGAPRLGSGGLPFGPGFGFGIPVFGSVPSIGSFPTIPTFGGFPTLPGGGGFGGRQGAAKKP